ncbi:MAG: M12 family metallo-peptidase, partial [Alcanivorax sp.]|uniref:M12 family metallo-peptidase n=1 Tax=Alcanivorax sp. TaxID=1872427 RepID=UPI003DA788EA
MAMRFRRPLAAWHGLLLATLLFPGSHAAAAAPQASTELFIDGSRYRAVLEPSTARIGMSDADRKLLQGNHYSGALEQVPGSWVRLSHLGDNWSGVVSLNGDMHIIDSDAFSQRNNLPVARSLQSLQAPGTCGVGNGTHSSLELPTREGASARSGEYQIAAATLEEMCTEQVDGVCLLPEKYLIVDHLFQQKHPDTYQDKVVELLNIIDGFYRNDLNMVFDNLHVEFPGEELLLESTSANELLVDLREKYHGFPFADTSTASPLMELLSGREFDGSTVGLAYVGTLCNTNGYATGVTQEYVNIPLTAVVMAHEIGHNFGANHDNVEADQVDNPERYCGNGYIMSSWAEANATGFSSCSVNQMTAKVDSLGNHDACFNYPVDAGFS